MYRNLMSSPVRQMISALYSVRRWKSVLSSSSISFSFVGRAIPAEPFSRLRGSERVVSRLPPRPPATDARPSTGTRATPLCRELNADTPVFDLTLLPPWSK